MVDGVDEGGHGEAAAGGGAEKPGRGGMTVVTTAVLIDATLPKLSINMRTATNRQILRLQASLADGESASVSGRHAAGGKGKTGSNVNPGTRQRRGAQRRSRWWCSCGR